MRTLIFLGGLYNLFFAVFHTGFWKMWKWDSELSKLSTLNSGVMQILNIQIIYYFLFTAVVCFAFPTTLQSTKLGKCFLLGTAGFWFIRTIQQFIFFWANNAVVFVFPAIFLIGTLLFLIPACKKSR